MSEYFTNKKFESFKIPDRNHVQVGGASHSLPTVKQDTPVSQDDGLFYVIDYDASNMKGVGKFKLQSQPIEPPRKDDIRELFHSMRDIARANHSQYYASNRFYDKSVHQENAKTFYKQGLFMKDFTDSFDEVTPFSSYFPYYQMMNYEQLRTYFTWRTQVRAGNVTDTSLSYAFLYIYELLDNIGVDDPQDGLNKLMSFWKDFSVYNKTIDKYVLRWLKDYHIYYELPQSFKEFVEKNNLAKHYPKLADTENNFDLFCAISKYDIRSSAFFADDKIKLITDCFYFITDKLRQVFVANGIHFDESIFQPTKKMTVWQPFKDALFCPWVKQSDRRIVLSENEIYICSHNNWVTSSVITSENGSQLIGYVMKQMEAVLRTVTKYKYKLSANLSTVTHPVVEKLSKAGLSLEKIASDAVMEFYRETTKTVVTVDYSALSRIRQEALATQEKLIVPEQEEPFSPISSPIIHSITKPKGMSPVPAPISLSLPTGQDMPPLQAPLNPSLPTPQDIPPQQMSSPHNLSLPTPQDMPSNPAPINPSSKPPLTLSLPTPQDMPPLPEPVDEPAAMSEAWESLKNALSETELQALSVLMLREKDIKAFADNQGIMLEVLIDGINEKAMDFVGDNLLDEEFTIYDDYKAQVKEMVG